MFVLKKLFRFLIFSNLFIALCAAIMAYQVKTFIKVDTNIFLFQLFLFFATLTSYSFHWYLTKAEQGNTAERIIWLFKNRKVHLYFFYAGFIGSAILLFLFVKYWLWFLPAVLLTFLYSAPKLPLLFFKSIAKFIIAKTVMLSMVWTYVTTVLPFIIYGGKWENSYTEFSLYRFTFITAVCILFDIRDKDYDLSAGIRNIVIWFPLKTVKIIFGLMITSNLATIGMMMCSNSSRMSFSALLIPVIILTILFKLSLKTNNDYLFYFVLDGLMALSAILFYFFV